MLEIHFSWSLKKKKADWGNGLIKAVCTVCGGENISVHMVLLIPSGYMYKSGSKRVRRSYFVYFGVSQGYCKMNQIFWYAMNPGFLSLGFVRILLMFRHCAEMVWCRLGISMEYQCARCKAAAARTLFNSSMSMTVIAPCGQPFQTRAKVLDRLKSSNKCF